MFGGKLGVPELLVLMIVCGFFFVFIYGWARIFQKAGHSGALCLLMFVPLLNLVTFLWFAFSEWPIEKRDAATRVEATVQRF